MRDNEGMDNSQNTNAQAQTGAFVFIGVLLVIAGIAATRGTVPLGGLILAMLGIALVVVGFLRRNPRP